MGYKYIDPDNGNDITDQVPTPTPTPTAKAGGAPAAAAIPGTTGGRGWGPGGAPLLDYIPRMFPGLTASEPETPYDVAHHRFSDIRRPATALVRSGVRMLEAPGQVSMAGEPGESEWMTHTVVPQTETQAALYPLVAAMGFAESGVLDPLVESFPQLRGTVELLKAASKTFPRRLATTAGTGYLAAKSSGEPGWKGGLEGTLLNLTGEGLRALGPVIRFFGGEPYAEKTSGDIAGTLEEKIPGIKVDPENPARITRGSTIVKDARAATQADRDIIDQAVGKNKVTMPHIRGGADVRDPVPGRMKLKKAEKQFSKLGDYGYGVGGTGKKNITARAARDAIDKYKGSIADELDAMQPGKDIGKKWLARRNTLSRAEAMTRLFKDGVIDETSGKIDPTAWSKAVLKHWDDLAANFGEDGANDLLEAGGSRKGMITQEAEDHSFHWRHLLPGVHPGRTLRPPRTWENMLRYPPRGFLSLMPGAPVTRKIMSTMFDRPQSPEDVMSTPPAASTTVPEEGGESEEGEE
jgi:hypothetical protein